jgi:hypothetical protein
VPDEPEFRQHAGISEFVRHDNPTNEGNPDTSEGARTFAVTEGRNSVLGAAALLDRYPNPSPAELFGPDFDRRPIDDKQSPKQFGTFDSFGFSMGGLVARTYQLFSLYLDPRPREIVDGEPQGPRTGRLAHMVSLGTPHHGALQFTRLVVSPTASVVSGIQLEQLLRRWSPGTADLLDYSDSPVRRVDCENSGNPALCNLNEDSSSAPIVETGLIAGTKSTLRLANGIDLDLGLEVLAVSGVESDAIVPVSSAHGESTLARRVVQALRKRKTFRENFDHLHVGTDATAQGEGDQRVSLFADRVILPTLRDHWVIRERGLVADEPIFGPGLVVDRWTSRSTGRRPAASSPDSPSSPTSRTKPASGRSSTARIPRRGRWIRVSF